MKKRGQTSMEYLLMVGAGVLLVATVAYIIKTRVLA